jgi:hypothetical protein
MKRLLFFIGVLLPISGSAQIHASKITISANGFIVKNSYTTTQQPAPNTEQTDTVVASYAFSTDSDVVVSDTSVTFNLSGRSLYNGNGPSYIDWSYDLDIEFDTSFRKITSLNTNYSGKWYYDYPPDNTEYWSDSKKSLSIKNIPYLVSLSNDTLIIYLDTSTLRNSSFQIKDYDEGSTRFTYTYLDSTRLLEIGTDAFIKVAIIGSFPPLGVTSQYSNTNSLVIDLNSKILKISIPKPIISLPCFDLLGRKHNLEFLGGDNNTATYSIRSLRPGVYFVSDGKVMTKFMIHE